MDVTRGEGREIGSERNVGKVQSAPTARTKAGGTSISAFQQQMVDVYGDRDAGRGLARTFAWFTEEVGELSRALFRGTHEEREHEFADVLAWLASLAAQSGVDLATAAQRYAGGCPRCDATPCACSMTR